jgi:hypothetical protein
MKITIQKTTTEFVEVDVQLPAFKEKQGQLFKIYEVDGKLFYDVLTKFSGGEFAYQQKFTINTETILDFPNTTIEHYSAELEKFVLSVVQDQNSLFEDDPIKRVESLVECHSELER